VTGANTDEQEQKRGMRISLEQAVFGTLTNNCESPKSPWQRGGQGFDPPRLHSSKRHIYRQYGGKKLFA
jgi:hypothetical protein